ncbi:unnamed protein product, partial [Iphiclides podalirius]
MADNDDYLESIDNNHLDGTNGSINMTDNSLGVGDEASGTEVPDLAAIKARVREMEEEAEKLKQMQTEVDKQMSMGSPPGLTSPLNMSIEEKIEADNRSVYVGNVDYGATAEELEQHFHGCGSINRVTILCNKFDGHPKGFAYIEFGDKIVYKLLWLWMSLYLEVMPKRTNKPGLSTTNRPPRTMRGRGRSFRGGFSPYYSGYRPIRRGRGFRRGMFYSPY